MELRFERAWEMIRGKAVLWAEGAVAMLPNLVVALIVMIAFALAARFIGKTLRSLLGKMSPNKSVVNLLVSILKIGIWSIGLFIALGVLKLDKTVTTLLASIGIIGLALGFAFQDIAANLISGIFLLIRHPFAPGDLIYTQFNDNSIDFSVRFWVKADSLLTWLNAKSEAIMAVKKAFDREGITIPFPIRTLEFDPGQDGEIRMAKRPDSAD